jgi:hypothetical protein
MNRFALLTATVVLAAPAAAAQASTGVVLTADAHGHAMQVVDATHHLHSLRYRGRVAHLRPGARVRYTGSTLARRIRVIGHGSASVSFVGRVVRSGTHGLVLQLAGGHRITFAAAQLHRVVVRHPATKPRAGKAASVTVNIVGLKPGESVAVTESVDGAGNLSLTITVSSPSGSSTSNGGGANASGGGDNSSGNDSSGGSDNSGASSGGDGSSSDPQDFVGTITAVSDSGLTVSGSDGTAQAFTVDDPSVTDRFSVGDQVDVTYQNLGGGPPDATDVEWVQSDVSGTVSAVSDASLTVAPDDGGSARTFTATPGDGTFDGISVGDPVDVTSHQAGGQTIVDNVDDRAGS